MGLERPERRALGERVVGGGKGGRWAKESERSSEKSPGGGGSSSDKRGVSLRPGPYESIT